MTTVFLRTWGDLACIIRPEMKVERVSYAIMTPPAEWATENPVIPTFLEMMFNQPTNILAN